MNVQYPLTPNHSGDRDRYRHAEPAEGIEYGAADMRLGRLPLRFASAEAFAQQFVAPHAGFDQTTPMVATPAFPQAPAAEAANDTQRLVACYRPHGRVFPQFAIAPRRYDQCRAAGVGGGAIH